MPPSAYHGDMPTTRRLSAHSQTDIQRAATILREGGTVAFPTETVYGLGANALSAASVAKIFAAKQRPAWDPLIVHVAEQPLLYALSNLNDDLYARIQQLSDAFWPGPLTLLLPKHTAVPSAVTAGRDLVGVRIPAHTIARTLIAAAGVPIAAPSANMFGHTSPTTAQHVLDDLDGRIDAVLDGGPTNVGLESTVLDPARTPMLIYRPGEVTAEQIERKTGFSVEMFLSAEEQKGPETLPSPGVGIRHYAPRARLILAEGSERALVRALAETTGICGVLLPTGWRIPEGTLIENWGSWESSKELAARLFACLRSLDERGATTIVCPLPEPGGLNDAIRDRLLKAVRPS